MADLAVVTAIGGMAAAMADFSPWVTVPAALLILWPARRGAEGRLWRQPTIRLAFISLLLLGLASNWSSYQRGVSDGFDAAAWTSQR